VALRPPVARGLPFREPLLEHKMYAALHADVKKKRHLHTDPPRQPANLTMPYQTTTGCGWSTILKQVALGCDHLIMLYQNCGT